MLRAVDPHPGGVRLVDLDDVGGVVAERTVPSASLPDALPGPDGAIPRLVWESSARVYPELLAAGVRVERCVDLRLRRTILRHAIRDAHGPAAAGDAETRAASVAGDAAEDALWDAPAPDPDAPPDDALFAVEEPAARPDPVREYRRQAGILAAADDGALRLLLAAESVGSLVAVELRHVGLPWSAERHDEILTGTLGPRPAPGERPARMAALLEEVRTAADDPGLNPDSPVELLRALHNAGIRAESTRSWELERIEHPAIAPLLEYKRLARLHSANGWAWLDEWVRDRRFRPVYVPGGVVTGRWASDGGGALQLPRQLRGAVVADPGWSLVVADAAQLEPRVLAAMSGDAAMALAGQADDMYEGIVRTGAVSDRREAKYGMLGAIYGGTTGVAARVLPRLERTFPRAMALVRDAARAGEEGLPVRTRLGRTSPAGAAPGFDESLTDAQRHDDRARRRAWGRFTRNFVVQGTAAEWALCWMGDLRHRLWELGEAGTEAATPPPFARRPHLAFFLHDELVVHTPTELAPAVVDAMRASATSAGRLLFGDAPVEWALSVAVVDSYDRAK